jgi:hypothetical protein
VKKKNVSIKPSLISAGRKKNKERKNINNKRWADKNRERVLSNAKKYRENNKEKLAVGNKRWGDRNKEKVAARLKKMERGK